MPTEGFKSITVREDVYDRFHEVFLKNKEALSKQGVHTFAAYITKSINKVMKETLVNYRFKLIYLEENNVVIKDTKRNRILNIIIQNKGLWCLNCQREFCIHTGFCFSLHQIYPLLAKETILVK